jgi:hypothetical protein
VWHVVDVKGSFINHDAWTRRMASRLADLSECPTTLLANLKDLSGRHVAALFAVDDYGWYVFTDVDDPSDQHQETVLSCLMAACPALAGASFDGAEEPMYDSASGLAGIFAA